MNWAELASLSVPASADGTVARAAVVYDGRWQVVWQLGRTKVAAGLAFDKPREAIRAARSINERNGQ